MDALAIFALLVLVLSPSATALTCYSCDSFGAGPACFTNPELFTTVECKPEYDHCYTYRLEQDGQPDQLNRNCCEVKVGSNVCPEGLDFQINTSDNPVYTEYKTSCSGDLCNTSEGNTGPVGGDGDGGGSIILPGKNSAGIQAASLALVAAALVVAMNE